MDNLLIYDLDGTLTISGAQISDQMLTTLSLLQKRGFKNIIVSGGKFDKIKWQIRDRIDLFYLIFPECGALCYSQENLLYRKRVVDMIDPQLLENINNKFIEIVDAIKVEFTGNRIDIRDGLIYLTPVGMDASEELRAKFIQFEEQTKFRDALIPQLKTIDTNDKLAILKGGKTGVCVYPEGQDKTQILEHLPIDSKLYFFGDNVKPDGNDYPLYAHPDIDGYEVKDYHHCIDLLTSKFFL